MTVLYINACVRDDSRTKRIADHVLEKLNTHTKEIKLAEVNIQPLNKEALEFRTRLSLDKDYDNAIFHYAKEYANADFIVIAAPYWDLSFPAILKNYIEAINVPGLTFAYNNEGIPVGLCKAKGLIYITTSGGKIVSDEFGYNYIKTLAEKFHGIKQVEKIQAENLDIVDSNIEELIQRAIKDADKVLKDLEDW